MTKSDPAPLHRRIAKNTKAPVLSDRQIIVRSRGKVSYIPMPRFAQAGAIALVALFLAWTANTTYVYVAHQRILSEKNATIAAREDAFNSLQDDLAQARQRFNDVTEALEKNHKGLVSLIGQNQALKDDLHSLKGELSRLQGQREHAQNEKAELARKIASLDEKLKKTEEHNERLHDRLRDAGSELANALEDKSRAHELGTSLSNRVEQLQGRLATLRESQSGLLDRIAETSQGEIKRLRQILASTGINLKSFLEKADGEGLAQGGPFEAAPENASAQPGGGFDVALTGANGMLDQLEGLQRVIRQLPLAAPLDYYYISSLYGIRKDPINGKKAMHRGLDFGSRHRATIYATAPGTVKYAGWRGKFGRFVEIDHGNGVITRYGHLRRIDVKRGQKVDYRTKVGQMGNSGRSTGTHLHYEIHVNGKSVDPLKFLKAGKNVFKG